jgi:hypothetical protein
MLDCDAKGGGGSTSAVLQPWTMVNGSGGGDDSELLREAGALGWALPLPGGGSGEVPLVPILRPAGEAVDGGGPCSWWAALWGRVRGSDGMRGSDGR